MTARPRHLRLVVANDAPLASPSWSTPRRREVLALRDDARSDLLARAARTVLPPRPTGCASTSECASIERVAVSHAPLEATALVLDDAQLGLLEDLALLRRSHRFVFPGAPVSAERTPSHGVELAFVRGLLVAESERALPRGGPGGGIVSRASASPLRGARDVGRGWWRAAPAWLAVFFRVVGFGRLP